MILDLDVREKTFSVFFNLNMEKDDRRVHLATLSLSRVQGRDW